MLLTLQGAQCTLTCNGGYMHIPYYHRCTVTHPFKLSTFQKHPTAPSTHGLDFAGVGYDPTPPPTPTSLMLIVQTLLASPPTLNQHQQKHRPMDLVSHDKAILMADEGGEIRTCCSGGNGGAEGELERRGPQGMVVKWTMLEAKEEGGALRWFPSRWSRGGGGGAPRRGQHVGNYKSKPHKGRRSAKKLLMDWAGLVAGNGGRW